MHLEFDPFDYSESVDFLAPPRIDLSDARVGLNHQCRLLVLLLNEIQNLAPPIVAASSVVNSLMQGSSGTLSEQSLLAFLPPEPASSRSLADQLVQSGVSTALLAHVQEFHARLGTARAMSISFCKFPADVRHKGGVHVEVLSGVWAAVCKCTATLIDALLAAIEGNAQSPSITHPARAIALLSICAKGGSPCVLDDGSVEIPGWAERRIHARWPVDWPAVLHLGPSDAPAQLINISLTGLCLTTREPLRPFETVTVDIGPGRLIASQVIWSKGTTYGMRFANALDPTDPIVVEAQLA